jgi:phosphoribosylaminoimidazole-succinocarboxamide synthase
MPNGIPDKGAILTQMSDFWFGLLSPIAENHLVATEVSGFPDEIRTDPKAAVLEGRSVLVRKTEVLPVECVVRGYLAGSGWRDYQSTGATSGVQLPADLKLASRLEEPIFTPATKAEEGHDENISAEKAADVIGAELAERVADMAKRLYLAGRDHAESCGLILADTKFEFGLIDGELLLIDEALTPDSSRFWEASDYEPGRQPENFDKQFVRDYLDGLDWGKEPPGPELPAEIVGKTRAKYLEAFRRLTGREFVPRHG